MRRLHDLRVLCVYGQGDRSEACAQLAMPNARVVAIASGHRMGSVAGEVGEVVRREARALLASAAMPEVAGTSR